MGAVIRSFKMNWQNCCIVGLIAVGIQSFAGIGIIAFCIGILFTILYSYLVTSYMYGALYAEAYERGVVA